MKNYMKAFEWLKICMEKLVNPISGFWKEPSNSWIKPAGAVIFLALFFVGGACALFRDGDAPSGDGRVGRAFSQDDQKEKHAGAPEPGELSVSDPTREKFLALLREKIAASGSTEDLLAVLKTLSQTNPALALDLAQDVARNGGEKFDLVSGVVQQWAEVDPQGVWNWAKQESFGTNIPATNVLMNDALQQMAKNDPQLLISDVAAAMQSGGWSSALQNEYALSSMERDAMQALLQSGHPDVARQALEQWSVGQGAVQMDDKPFTVVGSYLARNSVTDASTWSQALPESKGKDAAVAAVAGVWARSDPQAALNWAQKLDGPARTDALEKAFGQWVDQDTASAAQWLSQYIGSQPNPDSAATDEMITNMLANASLSHTDPKVALEWVAAISDAAQQTQSMEQVIRDWGSDDPAAASRFVSESTALAPEQKQKLLQVIQPNSP